MARRKTVTVEFVGNDKPGKSRPRNYVPWNDLLTVVFKRPGHWAKVWKARSAEQAQTQQANLTQRRMIFPDPTGDWHFASRGRDVFAKYEGPKERKRLRSGSVRRTQRPR